MTVERTPTAFGDRRGWIAVIERVSCKRSTPRSIGTSSSAPSCGLDPDPDLGGARFPPTVWPEQDDIDKAYARWSELGLGKPKPP